MGLKQKRLSLADFEVGDDTVNPLLLRRGHPRAMRVSGLSLRAFVQDPIN